MGSLRNTLHLLILFAVFKTIQSHPKDIATEETADYLNLSEYTIQNLVRSKSLPLRWFILYQYQ